MAIRREQGLCFNCDAKFTRGHRCTPPQFLCLLADESDGAPFEQTDMVHTISEPEPEPPPAEVIVQDTPCISYHAMNGYSVPSTLKIPGKIHGKEILVLIDGGSTNNFIQSRWATHLNLHVGPSTHIRVTVGNGDVLHCSGESLQVPLQLGDFIFPVDLLLLPIFGADVVLGVHWLSGLGQIIFDYKSLWMEFNHSGTRVRLQGLPPTGDQSISSSALKRQVHTHAATQFLHLSISLDPVSPASQPASALYIDPSAPSLFVNQFQNLVTRYAAIFSTPTSLPPVRQYDHKITLLPNTAPVNVQPYRYPHFQKTEIERLVGEMLRDGIIRPSSSPFSSPVILVKKRDSTWRFCVDYRALNAVTVKDRFPIPTVEELLDELASATIFSKLDLRSGYHQVRIHPSDIEKTAFRTHDGHYEFLVMPFGLSNAPSTFQALMNSIFRPTLRRFTLVFFDDILVYSSSWEAHLQHLQTVFELLQLHLLYAKLNKCAFGCSSIDYLGHKISGNGVQVDSAKIQAIQEWPLPSTLRSLRGFLGLTGYYRRFVQNYATIASPLSDLLRKGAFIWTPEATKAFQDL